MTRLYNDFRLFLGPQRFRALVFLWVITGGLSTFFLFVNRDWSITVQSVMLFIFLIGTVVMIVSAMEGDQRYKWGAILAPALLASLIGVFIVPQYLSVALGGALGWIIAGSLIFGRSREPIEYKRAVKAMRKGQFDEAVKALDTIIREEPEVAHHYRFRAEMLRFAGKLPRAKNDYERMKNLAKTDVEKAIAFNGMAEVDLQAKNYKLALASAQKAYELAPQDWVTAYNLGMIQDRLADSEGVIDSLTQKLTAKVSDVRHRLLIHFYIVRAYARLQQLDNARQTLEKLKRDGAGLREWEMLLAEDSATPLREVLGQDVKTVKSLLDGSLAVDALT